MKRLCGLSRLLQQLAVEKLYVANKRSLASLARPARQRQDLFLQFKRGSAQDKKKRDAKHLQKLKVKRIEAKRQYPQILIPPSIKVGELAQITGRTPVFVKEQIFHMKAIVEGIEFQEKKRYPLNETFSGNVLSRTVKKLGFRPIIAKDSVLKIKEDKDIYAKPVTTEESKLLPRPPVVAVMGHVDHGKTTILDALRKTSVAASEAGGITQSIGAFSVPLTSNETVTFIDTPGHSVFTSMRERGAKVTDVIVLVVAADDGVMEQTVESINMAKMSEASIVVALNKCDKKQSEPDLVVEELDGYGIKCQEIGGTVPATRISALKNIGLDKLVQSIVDQSAKLKLNYDPDMQVQGFVLESKTEKGRGNMVSIVLKQGTLKVGKVLVSGTSMAKVKLLLNANGEKIETIQAGEAAHVMGWKSLPNAGQMVLEAANEQEAKAAIKQRVKEMEFLKSDDIWKDIEEKRITERREYEEIALMHRTKSGRRKESYIRSFEKNKIDETMPHLDIIVKADVDGSMEALMKILDSYDCNEVCRLSLVSSGIGELKLSEYQLAEELGATIFLFNTQVSPETKKKLTESATISQHRVIYHLVDDLIEKINDTLPFVDKKVLKGEAEVLQVFKKGKRSIAGCKIHSGTLEAKDMFAIVRQGSQVHEGPLSSMRERTAQISKATAGNECGLMFDETCDSGVEVGDTIQCYSVVEEAQKIKWRPPGF